MFGIYVNGDVMWVLGFEGSLYSVVFVVVNEMFKFCVYVIVLVGSDFVWVVEILLWFWVDDLVNGECVYKNMIFNGSGL